MKHQPPLGSLSLATLAVLATVTLAGACADDAPGDEADEIGSTDDTGTDTTDADTTDTGTTDTGTDTTDTGTEEPLLAAVAEALGGARSLQELETLRLTAMGDSSITEEGWEPEASFPTTTFTEQTTIDLVQDALRIDIDRSVGTFGVPTPQTLSEIVVGGQGWIDGVESLFQFPAGEMLSDRVASERRQQMLLHPELLIRAALLDPGMASEGAVDGELAELIIADPVHPISLWIDSESKLPVSLTTLENDHVWRDVEIRVDYGGWTAIGDAQLMFPTMVELSVRDLISRTEQRDLIEIDLALPADTFTPPGDFSFPRDGDEAARGARNAHFHQVWANAGLPRDGLDLQIIPIPVPGHDAVTLLTGPSAYNTLVVEGPDSVVVVEAPLYAQRCEAILDWIGTEIGKPVSAVLITHHHYDHSACARTFVGAGATLYAASAAEGFWDQVLLAESTIEPDRLAMSGAEPALEVADGSLAVAAFPISVEIYEVPSEHAADAAMILADGVLFTSDLYSPGFTQLLPYGPGELLAAIDDHGIAASIDAIVGGHGGEIHDLAQLEAAAMP